MTAPYTRTGVARRPHPRSRMPRAAPPSARRLPSPSTQHRLPGPRFECQSLGGPLKLDSDVWSVHSTLFVAGRAFTASLCLGMTRHTGSHIMHHLFGDHIALANRSMAGFTCGACLSVHTVAEVDERRNPVDADPWNWFLLFGARRYLLNTWTVSLYCLVTAHAETLRRKPHKFTGISVSVARTAFQSQRQMRFVTIRNRLLLAVQSCRHQ